MGRYLPGAILATFGVIAYVIGCALYLAYRRQRAKDASRTLQIYAIAMMILGMLALGAGLYALEMSQLRALGG